MYKEQMHKEKEEKLKQENKKRKTVSNIQLKVTKG